MLHLPVIPSLHPYRADFPHQLNDAAVAQQESVLQHLGATALAAWVYMRIIGISCILSACMVAVLTALRTNTMLGVAAEIFVELSYSLIQLLRGMHAENAFNVQAGLFVVLVSGGWVTPADLSWAETLVG